MAVMKVWDGSKWVAIGGSGPPGTGGGTGAVDSVNTQTGDVVLDADDIDDTSTTNKFATAAQLAAVDALGTLAAQDDIAVPDDITATGTASSSTYLRGDGAWATPSGTATKQAMYVIAASNAPTWAKDRADVVCDGTSDQVEIQAALDNGYPVLLTQGLFVVSAQINITSLGLLRGMGFKTVIRPASNYTTGDSCVIGSKNNSAVLWTIEDLAIDGAYLGPHGIKIYNDGQDTVDPPAPGSDNYGTIRNVLIEGTKGKSTAAGAPGTCAIWLDDNTDGLRSCNIMDIIIRGCDTCIYLESSDHMVSNVHGNSDWDGLRVGVGAGNCRFTNIKMFFCDNIGIKVESGARGNTFSGCEVQDQNGIGYQIYGHETTMSACQYNIVSASRTTTKAFDIWCDGSTFAGLMVQFTTGSSRTIDYAFDFHTSTNCSVFGTIGNPASDFDIDDITGTLGTGSFAMIARVGEAPYLVNDALATVATTGDYSDLSSKPTLGTAAAEDATDFASATDTRVECIWNGSAWVTNAGGTVPTSTSLLRMYSSLDDAAATEPPIYNANDVWFKVLA